MMFGWCYSWCLALHPASSSTWNDGKIKRCKDGTMENSTTDAEKAAIKNMKEDRCSTTGHEGLGPAK